MFKLSSVLIFLSVISIRVSAQYFQTGEDPASVRWRNIHTANFQLIYPEEFEGQAQRMAGILEKVYGLGGQSLNHNPQKIPVILHTRTVKSNGLLAWAPRRVELYTTPHQSVYPQDWLQQLAIHEFRHVVQLDKVSQDLPKIIPFLVAQQGAALVAGAYLPFWFLEGDAVVTETALTDFGRGRSPAFLMETQAQLVEKGLYPLDKAYLGSYHDFVPDHYKMGYYLVGGARKLFGPGLWEGVVDRVGEKPFSLTPFNSAIKKHTGFNQKQLYKYVFDSLRTAWLVNDRLQVATEKQISKTPGVYTNYEYNFFIGGDSLLSYKTALNSVAQFILVSKDGREKRIFTPGAIFDESVSMTGNLLVWSENVPDLRWEHSGKSLIHILNIGTKEEQTLHPESKGFSPAVSPDKKKLALVEADFSNNFYLSVYDINTNKLIQRFQTKENYYFITPKWLDNERLVCILLTGKGKVLAVLNPFENRIDYLSDESLGDINHPVVNDSDIYFVSSYDGKNSLYVLSFSDRKIYRVYNPRFGVGYPAVSTGGDKIVVSDYTADGFRLVDISEDSKKREPIETIERGSYPLAEKLASQEPGTLDFNKTDSVNYKSEQYSKIGNLLNFHSWAPVYIDVSAYDVQPGVSIMSQNMLGTAETMLGYKWDVSEKTGRFSGKFIYKGWYPAISAEVTYGKRASEYYYIKNYIDQQNGITISDTIKKRFTWGETTFDLGAWVPLNLSKGKYLRLLQPEIKYELTARGNTIQQPDWFASGIINILSYRLYYHQISRKSYQDLVPNFGVIVDLSYRHSPGGNLDIGSLSSFQMVNYLPGAIPNHGFVIYNGFQNRAPSDGYYFSDVIRYPRGWVKTLNNRMYSLSIDYKMPLFYPDWSLGKLVYMKRLKATLYADFAHQQGDIYTQGGIVGSFERNISGIGAELTCDVHFLRFYAPANIGFRVGYLPATKQFHSGFLFSIDFTSF